MELLFAIDIPGLSIEGLPDSIGLITAIAGFLLVLSVIWFVIKSVLKLAMRIFWTGCILIVCLGSFLVIAALFVAGG